MTSHRFSIANAASVSFSPLSSYLIFTVLTKGKIEARLRLKLPVGEAQRVLVQARHGQTVAYSHLRTAMTNKGETYYKIPQRPKDNYFNSAYFFIPTRTY
jgi:hypothetical protein